MCFNARSLGRNGASLDAYLITLHDVLQKTERHPNREFCSSEFRSTVLVSPIQRVPGFLIEILRLLQ